MNNDNKKIYLEQIDKKIKSFSILKNSVRPPEGWVHAIRTALGMSLSHLGKRLNQSPQSIKGLEDREKSKAITLNALEEVARALDMRLVYSFIPKEKSLKKMLESQAETIAKSIVMKTSKTMHLENQGNSKIRINKAIKERKKEIIDNMPRYLWD